MIFLWVGWPAAAQKIVFRFDGSQAGETLGAVVARLGDLDGDGIPEIGASAPLATETIYPRGRVAVYSGATGNQILQLDPVNERGMCWALADAGDVDGDGVPDILVGAPFSAPPINLPLGMLYGAGSALVYSGRTGGVMFAFDGADKGGQVGHSIASLADIDGDGVPDMIVGAPYAGVGMGNAVVRSGANGEIIFQFDGSNLSDYLGWAVAPAGDLDGDGVPDMLIGAPGHASAGAVSAQSGATGDLIFQVEGEAARDSFGGSLAAAGGNIIVGAPGASPDGRNQAGSVFVYSAASGKLLFRFDGPESFDALGASVAAADVDGDGVPDIIAGAPSASPNRRPGAGSAFVFSGATGELLFRFDGTAAGETLGLSVAAAGDLNGDGRSEVIVGSPYSSPGGLAAAGSVFVLSYP